MTVERLKVEEVRHYDNQRLVDSFEVASRLLNDTSNGETMVDMETKSKNLNTLRSTLFERLRLSGCT